VSPEQDESRDDQKCAGELRQRWESEASRSESASKQAASLGYRSNKRAYHVQAGNWLREHRGIYRLALFPEPARPDLILWWLWSRDRSDRPVGVFSHHTALSLHELSDGEVPALSLGELIELSLSFTGRLPSLHNGSTFLTYYAEQDALLANTSNVRI
jgi:hypothetical protein